MRFKHFIPFLFAFFSLSPLLLEAQCSKSSAKNSLCSLGKYSYYLKGTNINLEWKLRNSIDRIDINYTLIGEELDSTFTHYLVEEGAWEKTPNKDTVFIPCEAGQQLSIETKYYKNRWWTPVKGDVKLVKTSSETIYPGPVSEENYVAKFWLERKVHKLTAGNKHTFLQPENFKWYDANTGQLLSTGPVLNIDFRKGKGLSPGIYQFWLEYSSLKEGACYDVEGEFHHVMLLPNTPRPVFLEEAPPLKEDYALLYTICNLEGENQWPMKVNDGVFKAKLKDFLNVEMIRPEGNDLKFEKIKYEVYEPEDAVVLKDGIHLRVCASNFLRQETNYESVLSGKIVELSYRVYHPKYKPEPYRVARKYIHLPAKLTKILEKQAGQLVVSDSLETMFPAMLTRDTGLYDMIQIKPVLVGSSVEIGPESFIGDTSGVKFIWNEKAGLEQTEGMRVVVNTAEALWIEHGGNAVTYTADVIHTHTGFTETWATRLVRGELYTEQENEEKEYQLKTYPNPGLNQLVVETDLEGASLKVYDGFGGEILQTKDLQQNQTFNTSAWKPGLYIVVIQRGKERLQTRWLKE